jgi:ABC-type molybdate transport system permease subunit
MPIKIKRADLLQAAEEAGIAADHAEALWGRLEHGVSDQPKFDAIHVLYYFGALLSILGMGILGASQWDSLGGLGIVAMGLGYAAVFVGIAEWLRARAGRVTAPVGLLVTMAVSLTPVVVFGLQLEYGLWGFDEPGTYSDFHKWIRSGWFAMEVATVVTASLALAIYRFPFLTAPIAFVLWYMSMDLTPILFPDEAFGWEERRQVSVVFGALVLLVAYVVDLRSRRDFAFWLYLSGILAFWGGLSAMDSDSELGKFLYFLINIGLIALGVFLRRRTLPIFGAFGVIGYVGYLSYEIFDDEIMFTMALGLIGMVIVGLGVVLAKLRPRIEAWAERAIPPSLQRFRPG